MNAHAADFVQFQNGTVRLEPAHGQLARILGNVPQFSAAPEVMQLVTSRSGFDRLETEWNDLFARAGRGEQMFQTFNWLWHWANHFLPSDARNLAIVTIRRSGRLVGVLPLVVERVAGLKQLVFMGAPVSQYNDALVERTVDTTAMLSRALDCAMQQTGAHLASLAKVRDDAALAPVLAGLKATVTSFEEAPFVDVDAAATLPAYEKRFSSKCLKNRRRLQRRLEERGPMAFAWDLPAEAGADASRATMVFKRAWLKTRGRLSRAFADVRTDRFFADVCRGDVRPAGTAVHLLTTNGEIANAAITVTVNGRQALHILAYGLKFEKCAAGILHVEALIRRAFETGIRTFDFLAPRHDYKLEWADGAVRVADYALPATPLGRAYTHVYLGFVREHMKAAINQAPGTMAKPIALLQAFAKSLRR